MKSITRTIVSGMIVSTLAVLLAGPARASTQTSCTVTGVFYDDTATSGGGAVLTVACSSGFDYYAFFAQPTGSSCVLVGIDTIKLYTSLALAAKLDGQPLIIFYNNTTNCDGGNLGLIQSMGG
jgi:hypothetical protein